MVETKGGSGRVLPLQGVRVLDLSRVLAGPSSTMMLADLGADVIKVENPGAGDDTRTWGTKLAPGQSSYYVSANRNKRDIALDFNRAEACAIVRDLARTSDVVVENFKLGGLDRFGLDYASLSALNPRLIYCSISGYGRTGPAAARPGYDFVAQAEAGLMSINGEEGQPPLKVGYATVDLMTGMYAAQSILAALIAREKTGRGQHIDLALYDCAVATLSYLATATMATGKAPIRYGNAHPDVVPYELFPAADGDLVVAIGNDGQFRKFCLQVLERPDLAADPRFATNPERVKNRPALSAAIAEALRTRPRAAWLGALQAAGVPGGEVRDLPEVLAAPETAARGMVCNVPHPTAGSVGLLASPMKFSDTPVREVTAPPLIGQHTDEILRERLGLGAERIQELRQAGAIA